MFAPRGGLPQKTRVCPAKQLLVRGPRLDRARLKCSHLEAQIRVGKDGSVERGTVCLPCPRAQTRVCIEPLTAAKQIPQHCTHVGTPFRGARLGTRLDGVAASFLGTDVDGMIGRGGRRIGRLGSVDIGRYGLVEDIEAVERVNGATDLGQCLSQGVVGLILAIGGEDGMEDALEEGMPRVICVEDSDGGDGYGRRRVERDLAVGK